MKKSVLISIVVVLAIMVLGVGYYFVKRDGISRDVNIEADKSPGEKSLTQQGRYIGDGFSVEQMLGWTVGQIPSTLVSFHNYGEEHPAGSPAAKINFKSYGAVSFDMIGEKTLEEIYQTTIETVTRLIPSAKVSAVEEENINGMPAKLAVLDLNQQGVNFKVLLAVYLAGDKYYTMSFNTTAEKWPEYEARFYAITRSFETK